MTYFFPQDFDTFGAMKAVLTFFLFLECKKRSDQPADLRREPGRADPADEAGSGAEYGRV